MPEEFYRVRLELHRGLRAPQGVAEQEIHAFAGAEYVANGLETATLHLLEKECRAIAVERLPSNFSHLQVRVYFFVDAFKHPRLFQIQQGLSQVLVHGKFPLSLAGGGSDIERIE